MEPESKPHLNQSRMKKKPGYERLPLNMRLGKDGNPEEFPTKEGAQEEPSIQVDSEYAAAAERKEQEQAFSNKLDEIIGTTKGIIEVKEKALQETRTLDIFKKSIDDKLQKGYEISMAPTEESRVREAITLNDGIKESKDRIESLSIAKQYYEFVRQGLDANSSEANAIAKTLETMEGEEVELATKHANGTASKNELARLGYLKGAKAWVKHLNK